jgi:hypothetical protein
MRVTKSKAELAAKKMTSKTFDHLQKLRSDYAEKSYRFASKLIPDEIMKMNKKHPGWLKSSCNCVFFGEGINHRVEATLKKPLPIKAGEYRLHLELTPSESKEIASDYREIHETEKRLRELRRDLTNVLINLRTYKRVETEFKEAFKFLPKTETENSVALPMKDIISRVNNQP